LWSEVSAKCPHYEFRHSFGLGVLFTGEDPPDELRGLMDFLFAGPAQARSLASACEMAASSLATRVAAGDQSRIKSDIAARLILRKEPPAAPPSAIPALPTGSRNSLCPCGSGKKYKHCHGRFG
jgi:hypothetical protein